MPYFGGRNTAVEGQGIDELLGRMVSICRLLIAIVAAPDFSTKDPMFVRDVGENHGKDDDNHG